LLKGISKGILIVKGLEMHTDTLSAIEPSDAKPIRRPIVGLSLAALGVVYGDIGTSPLYAFKQCFNSDTSVAATPANVLGVLSLIVWSLILVVSIKYLWFVLKADNRGEGGIIALVALLNPWNAPAGSRRNILMIMGLFGAALLFGDGTITPAISVLSAVEGLKVESASFNHLVIPITVGVLLVLFASQSQGTSKIGALFGPVMLIWFSVLAVMGVGGILHYPGVFAAFNPFFGLGFLLDNGFIGFIILGTVFLSVTGAEALYADMGHFGRQPIRYAWFFIALPALLLNYFGQGAIVLADPETVSHPFYGLGADWAHYPLVLLATIATIIASQAVISGVFSLTRQAIHLGQLPAIGIMQTDRQHIGQIYIPFVNWALMFATIGLVVSFRTSDNLASAYGLAVAADMVITTCLAYFVARRFGWNPLIAGGLAAVFLVIDLAFLGANLFKFFDGGWYPVLVALIIFSIMAIWRKGIAQLTHFASLNREPLTAFFARIKAAPPMRFPGTAIYLTASLDYTPQVLLNEMNHAPALHERIIFVTVKIEDVPRVPSADRATILNLAPGFYRIILRYGFMQNPNLPVALRFCDVLGLSIDPDKSTFYVGRDTLLTSPDVSFLKGISNGIFAFLWRNSARVATTYNLPPEQVISIGRQIKI
jgi:KUP system potassium uptake protein